MVSARFQWTKGGFSGGLGTSSPFFGEGRCFCQITSRQGDDTQYRVNLTFRSYFGGLKKEVNVIEKLALSYM